MSIVELAMAKSVSHRGSPSVTIVAVDELGVNVDKSTGN